MKLQMHKLSSTDKKEHIELANKSGYTAPI